MQSFSEYQIHAVLLDNRIHAILCDFEWGKGNVEKPLGSSAIDDGV